jgi:hypothetical protein
VEYADTGRDLGHLGHQSRSFTGLFFHAVYLPPGIFTLIQEEGFFPSFTDIFVVVCVSKRFGESSSFSLVYLGVSFIISPCNA